ncbi:MAG: radical SAM family heme chaperone HemW [Candidatus Methylophosphatis roskildensis]
MSERRVIPLRAVAAIAAGSDWQPRLTAMLPLSLYVHWPWCVKKCPYCDFNSHEARQTIPEAAYLAALIADLEHALPSIWGRRVSSVFIGGGTPSLMSAATVDQLLTAIRTLVTLIPEAEITLEANPGTVEAARFAAFREAGINRISLGIQSFDDARLRALGRIHDSIEARAAIDLALRHFDNVNLDLMYALPGQTLADAAQDVDTLLSFGTPHLSCYQLTLEPNTAFAHAPPDLPDTDLAADMQDMVEDKLGAAGYEHYETSAFARPGRRCRHNLNYWQFGDYLGIGAGAHGKLSSATRIWREARERHPNAYLDSMAGGRAISESREVGASELPFEFMMNALRLTDGFATPLFAERTGLPIEAIEPQLIAARSRGLLEADRQRIRPTATGQRFLNDLLQIFLED